MPRVGALKGFAVAGADKKFAWAHAEIEGHTVVLSSADVPHPVAVRYAWADNPEGCNLYNAAGLRPPVPNGVNASLRISMKAARVPGTVRTHAVTPKTAPHPPTEPGEPANA